MQNHLKLSSETGISKNETLIFTQSQNTSHTARQLVLYLQSYQSLIEDSQ